MSENTNGTSSAANDLADWFVEPGDTAGGPMDDTGPSADIAVPETPAGRRGKKDTSDNAETGTKAGPPTLDEWERLFSKFLIRAATEWYIDFAFRDIPEEALSERDAQRLLLSDEERTRICVPFAELANKSKFARKHGRMIVAGAESIDSVLTLGIWFNRVNRIRGKHAAARVVRDKRVKGGRNNERARQSEASPEPNASANGHGAPVQGIVIIPGDG